MGDRTVGGLDGVGVDGVKGTAVEQTMVVHVRDCSS